MQDQTEVDRTPQFLQQQTNGNVDYLKTFCVLAKNVNAFHVAGELMTEWIVDNGYMHCVHPPLSVIAHYFDDFRQLIHSDWVERLSEEVRGVYLNLLTKESVLQDRYGSLLVNGLLREILPAIDVTVKLCSEQGITMHWEREDSLIGNEKGNDTVTDEPTGDYDFDLYVCENIREALTFCAQNIIENLKLFSPNHYNAHEERFKSESYKCYRDKSNVDTTARPNEEPESVEPGAKLQWTCKPAVAGYIISELIRAGYLAPPTTGGEYSMNKLAGICNQIFDVKDYSPSIGSWRNVIDPERNTLPDPKRAKLVLPDLDQLT